MKVFYDPRQCASQQSESPSAEKPKWVVADWQSMPELGVEVMPVEPASIDEICRAHKRSFVEGVLECKEANGFGNRLPQVAAALPWTSGSLLSAARWAVDNQSGACSPTSGFHHAEWDKAMGFCTFNGLMVAALALRKEGRVDRVGIIDCDAHYGNGTEEIKGRLGIGWVVHRTMGARFRVYERPEPGAFERWLDESIDACKDCSRVIYQAGADPHVDDPYGGVLSSLQMSERDKRVFQAFKGRAIVWNLAGGYQVEESKPFPGRIEPVLALHRTTAMWHRKIFE